MFGIRLTINLRHRVGSQSYRRFNKAVYFTQQRTKSQVVRVFFKRYIDKALQERGFFNAI